MSAPTVTKVDLSGNNISAKEAAVLADGLYRSESLTSMDMADNRLGDAGKLALARAIPSSNLLCFKCGGLDLHADVECLDLSWQELGPADLEVLAAGMRQFMHALVQVTLDAPGTAHGFVNSCTSTPLPAQLDLSYNMLCGVDADGNGTYTAQGLRLIANAITTSTCEQASFACGKACHANSCGAGMRCSFSRLFAFTILPQISLASIQLCCVDGCGHGAFTEEGVAVVGDMIRKDSPLRSCDVTGNFLSDAAKELLLLRVKGCEGFVLKLD
eukprot:6632315-Prymnesium_polylepis.1